MTASPGGISVCLLAVDPICGRRVANALASADVSLVARGSSLQQLADAKNAASAEVVIAVFDTFGPEASEVIPGVVERFPEVGVLVVVTAPTPTTVRDAMAAGARGVLSEADVAGRLPAALQAVASSLVVLPVELWRSVGRPKLTPREKQIMAMVVMGFTNREIANRLVVAETTVKSHLSSTFEKLGVRSRQEAAALILDTTAGLGTGILAITERDDR
jgi:DNA-binding NarL/FixJ family response regulator